MTGRLAVYSHQQRIEAAIARTAVLSNDAELIADQAKYLCILVSGFIEKSLSEIVLEHARRTGAPTLQKFVEQNTARFTNANTERVLQLLGSFSANWRKAMEAILIDEYKAAFDSVYGLRNQIVHGTSVGVTYVRVKDYFNAIKYIIERIQDLCIPDK